MKTESHFARTLVPTGHHVRLRIQLGTVRFETDLGPGDGSFGYTLRADDGSYEKAMQVNGDDATNEPLTLTFVEVPMDKLYSLEVAPPDGGESHFAFEAVPFHALEV